MELANHPEYQAKAREDIEKAIKKHGWSYEAINDMKYLDQALAEGIRLHPPVSTIDRYTRQDYTVSFCFFPTVLCTRESTIGRLANI